MTKNELWARNADNDGHIPSSLSGKYRIYSIVPQALSKSEELSEIKSCDFASKEELTSEFPMYTHLVYVVYIFKNGRYSFRSVA